MPSLRENIGDTVRYIKVTYIGKVFRKGNPVYSLHNVYCLINKDTDSLFIICESSFCIKNTAGSESFLAAWTGNDVSTLPAVNFFHIRKTGKYKKTIFQDMPQSVQRIFDFIAAMHLKRVGYAGMYPVQSGHCFLYS